MSFPTVFGIASPNGRDPWLVGVINAAPYFGKFTTSICFSAILRGTPADYLGLPLRSPVASAGLGVWLSDPLNRICGRRGVIFITAIILIATPIGSAFTRTWQELFIARLLLGIGVGLKGSTVREYGPHMLSARIPWLIVSFRP